MKGFIRLLTHVSIMAAMGFAAFLVAGNQSTASPTAEAAYRDPREKTLARVDMDDMSYAQALTFLESLTDHKIIFDWRTLEPRGITPASTLHLHLHARDITVGDVMNAMEHCYDDNSRIDVNQWVGFRVTGDLVVFAERYIDANWKPIAERAYDVGALVSDGGMQFAQYNSDEKKNWGGNSPNERLGAMIQFFSSQHDDVSKSWSYFAIGDTLFVSDTQAMQDEIAGILHKLWRIRMGGQSPDEPVE